jgi:hypothetical protein
MLDLIAAPRYAHDTTHGFHAKAGCVVTHKGVLLLEAEFTGICFHNDRLSNMPHLFARLIFGHQLETEILLAEQSKAASVDCHYRPRQGF